MPMHRPATNHSPGNGLAHVFIMEFPINSSPSSELIL